jgi:GT2 family glycosyltransferase
MNEDRVIAVIPSLGRNIDRLNHCINSVKKYSNFSNLKIILVDNSPDGSLQNTYNVDEVIGLGINLGFVGAIEIVRRKFEAEFIWTLQDDISFSTNVLSNLMKEIKTSSQLAAVCPITLNKNLLSYPRSGKFINNDVTQWNLYPESGTEISSLDTEVDFIYSSGSLWRMSALEEINGFNLELYPLYHVDVDTCFRLKQKNWQVKLAPKAVIEHEGSGSTPKLLSKALGEINLPLMGKANRPKVLKYNELELEIILSIVKRASFLFLDVARLGNSETMQLDSLINELDNQRSENLKLHSDLQNVINSNSWKITKPLRKFREKFKI